RRLSYSTQIETSLEREFFHWITGKGLLELANRRSIRRRTTTIVGNPVNFYAHSRHRYWEREHRTMCRLLDRVFDPEFAQAIGRHGELMFDAALGRAGFRAEAQTRTRGMESRGSRQTTILTASTPGMVLPM